MRTLSVSLNPVEVAENAEKAGVKKVKKSSRETFLNAILAGAFIAVAFVFYVTVTTGSSDIPWGISKFLGGLAFSLGLVLVVICSGDLFTSSVLSIIPLVTGKVKFSAAFKNWCVVYGGNFVGSICFAVLIFVAGEYQAASGDWGLTALKVASHKLHHSFGQAVALGILCNFLVCLAIWMTYAAKSVTDKIMAVILPVTMFVASGFEHCVANMFMIPMGILIKTFAPESFWGKIGLDAAQFGELSWGNFVTHNLVPVTIGNFIGGAVLVGLSYWWLHLKKRDI